MFLSLNNVECDAIFQNWGGKYQHEIHKPAVHDVLNIKQIIKISHDKNIDHFKQTFTTFNFFYIHFSFP